MTKWINHVAIAAAANGTTTHTINPASTGTVVDGAAFTPTAGNFLVVVVNGAVTSTTPSGWTLPSGGSAINNSGLYVWHRAAAGSDSFSTTHNASNYACIFDIYEYPAGSTFVKSAAQTSVGSSSTAGPSITALTGTNLIMGALGRDINSGASGSVAWGNSAVEEIDHFVERLTNDGYLYSAAYLEDSVLTSASISTTVTTPSDTNSNERLIFAVNVAGGSNNRTGTAAQTLPKLAQAVVGTNEPEYVGSVAQTLPRLSQSASGTAEAEFTGTAAQTLPKLGQSASGTRTVPVFTGTSNQVLPILSQAAAGTVEAEFTGVSSQVLPKLAQSVAGTRTVPTFTGSSAQVLPRLSQAVSGTAEAEYTGTVSQSLPRLTQAAAGTAEAEYVGVVGQTLRIVGQVGSGTFTLPAGTGTVAQTLPSVTQSASGTAEAEFVGSAAQGLPRITQSATGTAAVPVSSGVATQTLPFITQAAEGTAEATNTGAAAQGLPSITQSATGTTSVPLSSGALAQLLPSISQAAEGVSVGIDVAGVLSQTLPMITQSGAGSYTDLIPDWPASRPIRLGPAGPRNTDMSAGVPHRSRITLTGPRV